LEGVAGEYGSAFFFTLSQIGGISDSMQDAVNTLQYLFKASLITAVVAYLFCMAIGAKRKLTNREMLFLFAMAFGIGLLLWLLNFTYVSVHNYLTRL
jgi:hypothetical protein